MTLAPVLNNITWSVGEFTVTGRNPVRMSSPTLGLLDPSGGPPTSWTVSAATSGDGHWTRAGGGTVAEGASALLPVPSSSGDGANLSNGSYTFNVTATNAQGTSNTAVLTIAIVANAASIGDPPASGADNFPGAILGAGPLYTAAEFCAANSNAPKKILISTGSDRGDQGINLTDFAFPAEVRIEHADPARPSPLASIALSNTHRLVIAEDMEFTGPCVQSARIVIDTGSSYNKATRPVLGKTNSDYVANVSGLLIYGTGCVGNEIVDAECHYQHYGLIYLNTGDAGIRNRVENMWVRYFAASGFYMGGSGLDLIKPWAVSPLRRTIGQHLDAFQIIDGTALSDSDVDHAIGLQADCNSGMQGFFGGSAGGSNKNTNLRIRYPFMGVWAITGMSLDSNGGASELLGPVMMKVNSGDEDSFPAPAGARFETIGPNLIFSAASAGNWAGTLTVVGGRIGDQTQILTAYPTPTYSPAPTDLARATDTTFVVGDARAVLEAADWAAMSKATLQAFTKDTLRHASAGPIDAAGNYRDLAPTFDATATTFDSSTLTWDHA